MLAKRVRVDIYGKLSRSGLYSGYAVDGEQKTGAYVISARPVYDFLYGVVIAVITLADSKDIKLVVAPVNEHYYEPQIRELLSVHRNIRIGKITCLYEKSCGAVVFHRSKQGVRILFVKNHNGRYWSFPKGHIEGHESEKQTAIREIKEETNLDVELISDFRETTSYCPFGKIKKHVVFFLAQAFTDDVKIQQSEIDKYMWVDFQQAKKLCNYENDLKLINKAEFYIERLN